MMSATGVKPSNGSVKAFTLIEICLAMFIVALVIGIGLPFASGLGRQGQLRDPAGELKKMALTARRRAVTEQKTVEILLENDRYILRDAVFDEEKRSAKIAPETDTKEVASYKLPSRVTYAVKRWDETKFSAKTDLRWRFLPTGLCEPITVHFTHEQDFLEFSFNPLTAQTEEESFQFQ
jgi:Tfp pilus assembly protein FimT